MNDDKIIPFTELDYEAMMKLRKEIFTLEFIRTMDSNEDKLSTYDKQIIVKLMDFLLNLTDEEEDPARKLMIFKPILYGLYEGLISCYYGINRIVNDLEKSKKDK